MLAEDIPNAKRLLAHHGLANPLAGLVNAEASLPTLKTADILLLLDGWQSSPSGSSHALVRSALERGFDVRAVPGPSLPITALIASGLPSDSFFYLGRIPTDPIAQRALLAAVSQEQRTLVVIADTFPLPALAEMLGQRPLALATRPDHGFEMTRWGTLAEAAVALHHRPVEGPCVLVIGGLPRQGSRWDEGALRAEIRARTARGIAAREIGRELTSESGWPRREIYRLAVKMRSSVPSDTCNDQDEA